jgi:hypothetical protein
MSNTFTAGQKMRAVDMVPQKIWTVSATSNSASIGTTETVIFTSPSTTYRAGRAYRITFRFRIQAATGALDATIAMRDTDASGFIRMSGVVYRIAAVSIAYGIHHEHIIVNTDTTDVTGHVLAMTLDNSTNTSVIQASSVHPAYFTCEEIGDADDYPEGVAF